MSATEMATVPREIKCRCLGGGDHIAVQGLADMLHVNIHLISTINPDMELIRISQCSYWSHPSWLDGSVSGPPIKNGQGRVRGQGWILGKIVCQG